MDDEKKNDAPGKEPESPAPEKGGADSPAKSAAVPEGESPAKPVAKKPPEEESPAKPVAKKPPAAPKPARKKGPAYEDLEQDALLTALQQRFGAGKVSGQQFLDQSIYTVELDDLYDVMLHLRDDENCRFDYLVDLTAMDQLGDAKRFCLVYHLYSHSHGRIIRVKSKIEEGNFAPSVTSIWTTADWLEREAYDMFGIEFSGHPDLRRILLPEDWHGFPLRKDYDIKLQDQSWIRKHLRIRQVPQ